MYQPSKCPYSYFSKALEFYFRVIFFPVSIFKIDLNAAEIKTVQDYVCTKKFKRMYGVYMYTTHIMYTTYIVLKLRVNQVTYESTIQ